MLFLIITDDIASWRSSTVNGGGVLFRKGQCSDGDKGYDKQRRIARKVFERAKRYHSSFRKGKT